MPFSSQQTNEAYVASGDLSSCMNRLAMQLADFKVGLATAGTAMGVIANEPKAGEHASIATDGIVLVRGGAALTADQYVTSATSGWAVVVTSGAGSTVVGRVVAGCASGMLAAVRLGQFYRPNSVGN
jgi:hypothetical protein